MPYELKIATIRIGTAEETTVTGQAHVTRQAHRPEDRQHDDREWSHTPRHVLKHRKKPISVRTRTGGSSTCRSF